MDEMFCVFKGHDPGGCFWIQPVRVHASKCFGWEAVEECSEEEISLDETDVYLFLSFIFKKYFDDTLIYNRERKDDLLLSGKPIDACFEWYLTYNFYTYETAAAMTDEIDAFASRLESEGLDCVPDELLEGYLLILNEDASREILEKDAESLKPAAVAQLPAVADYCRRVAVSIRTMMKNKPDWPLISIMGP